MNGDGQAKRRRGRSCARHDAGFGHAKSKRRARLVVGLAVHVAVETGRARPDIAADLTQVLVVHFGLAVIVAMGARKRGVVVGRLVALGALQVVVLAASDREGVVERCTFPHVCRVAVLATDRKTRRHVIRRSRRIVFRLMAKGAVVRDAQLSVVERAARERVRVVA